MSSSKKSVLSLSLRRRQSVPTTPPISVYEALSESQNAYAVFAPRPRDTFQLFEIIFLHEERSRSPRNTNTNLHNIFQELHLYPDAQLDGSVVNVFLREFRRVHHEEFSYKPEFTVVSEQSLRGAGLKILTPIASLASKLSRYQITERRLRFLWLSQNAYIGQRTLQRFIWNHVEAIFLLILRALDISEFPTEPGERGIMGIVTKRIIAEVGLSKLDQQGIALLLDMGSARVSGGGGVWAEKAKNLLEDYDNKQGVSGLHFIAFKIECLDRHRWKVYRGIDVCSSELDEKNNFSEAVRWQRGTGSLKNSTQTDYKTVKDGGTTGSGGDAKNAATSSEWARKDCSYVYLTYNPQIASFVDIDIRPYLSKFANEQCRLAACYRKVYRSNTKKVAQAVLILRSVLRKCCFESTVRALYDLSGCYLHGIGIQADGNMARLLRYCAGGMRRTFDRRKWWLRRLVVEIGFRRDNTPERSIGSMVLLSRWRLISFQEGRSRSDHTDKMKDNITAANRNSGEEFGRFGSSSESGKQQMALPPVQVAPHLKLLYTLLSEKDNLPPQNDSQPALSPSCIRKMRTDIREELRGTREEFVRFAPRILLVGPPGVGKSSLVNTVFGLGPREEAAVYAGGTPCTKHFSEYGPLERIPVIIIDSHGIQREISAGQRDELLTYIRSKNTSKRVEDHVHVAWYIPGEKWESTDTMFVQRLRDKAKVSVIVVLTKCDLRQQIDPETNLTAVEVSKHAIIKEVPDIPIVECASPPPGSTHWVPRECPRGHGMKNFALYNYTGTWICGGDGDGECNERGTERMGPFGHIELIECTVENVPEAVRTSLMAAQVVDKKKDPFSSLQEPLGGPSLSNIMPHRSAKDAKVPTTPHSPGIREVDDAECDQ